MGETQSFEGPKIAIKILVFACMCMRLSFFAAVLQEFASGSSGKHNFANCIFDANSLQGAVSIVFFPLARHSLVFFENHKISPPVVLGRPGGMRGGAGGRLEGGLRSARFESEDVVSAFDLTCQRLPYGKGVGSKCYVHPDGPIIESRIPTKTLYLMQILS